jgi:hypothetical protein
VFCTDSLRKYCSYLANKVSIQSLYLEYYGDQQGALKNFLQCGNWKKAHTIFMTSVAHSLFLSCKFFFNALENNLIRALIQCITCPLHKYTAVPD